MSHKNQKKYNKQLMGIGYDSMAYLKNNLGLINKYTSGYADRTDFWANKLNNRQLDLLSDKYLAQNASMLRGSAAFGSNSETNRQIENNAYSQANYLANVQNQNIMNANQLQNNELNALGNAAQIYQNSVSQGAAGAANVDAANNAWLNTLGKGLSSAGAVVKNFGPYGAAIGAGMQAVGGSMSGLAGDFQSVGSGGFSDPSRIDSNWQTAQEKWGDGNAKYGSLSGAFRNLFTQGRSNSSLSTSDFINPLSNR